MVKQITVEELFGSSIPKDPSLPAMPTPNPAAASSEPSATYPQNRTYPPPVHPSPLCPPHLAAQDPGSNQVRQGHSLLPTSYALHPNPAFQPVGPGAKPRSLGPVIPIMMPPAGSQTQNVPAGSTVASAAPRAYLEQELLSSLKPSVQSLNAEIHKPILAPNFLPSTLVPPHNFQERMREPVLQLTQEMDVLSKAPNLIKPLAVSCQHLIYRRCSSFVVIKTHFFFVLSLPLAGRPYESRSWHSWVGFFCASDPQRLPAFPRQGGRSGRPFTLLRTPGHLCGVYGSPTTVLQQSSAPKDSHTPY